MPQVRLDRYEADSRQPLPPVCMACGAKAVTYKAKNFSWCPQWVFLLLFAGLLPLLIVSAILTKRMRVSIPFCQKHRHYYLLRQGGLFLSAVLGILLACGGFIGLQEVDREGDLAWIWFLGMLGLGLVWLIAAVVVNFMSIRATEITDRDIRLTAVAPEFIEALMQVRNRHPGDDHGGYFRDRDQWDRPRGGPDQYYGR